MPRWYDPLEFWDLSGLPWNMADEGHRHKLHKWMRLYYATHPLISLLVDIFTRFPLSGMNVKCKDPELQKWYEEVFLVHLDYEDFLTFLGKEYWVVGEAFPFASLSQDLGIWEFEELLPPENIVIENFPMMDRKDMKIVPPEHMRRLAQSKSPAADYKLLEMNYAEWIPHLLSGEAMPVSDVLLKQVAFRITPWDDHGTPILLRALRTLIHEEKLYASQDAIAERLYSPLILAKLGIQDLGGDLGAWLPSPDDMEDLRDQLDIALASDFRLMVHHYGLDITSVFGREQVPDLGNDFDRIDRKLMQCFGVNPSLLSAGSNSQPYASSALQAEFMNQILRTYQKYLKKHFYERAAVLAEANKHFDYDMKGQTKVPLYEDVVVQNEDGTKQRKSMPKLLVPELEMEVLDMRDEATQRNYMLQLRSMGIPIPDEYLMVGFNFDFPEALNRTNEEMVKKTVTFAQGQKQAFEILERQGDPIPPDLAASMGAGTAAPGGGGGAGDPGPHATGPGGRIVLPDAPPEIKGMGAGATGGGITPHARPEDGVGPVPEVSNERRPSLNYGQGGRPLSNVTAGDDALLPPIPRPQDSLNEKRSSRVLYPAKAEG